MPQLSKTVMTIGPNSLSEYCRNPSRSSGPVTCRTLVPFAFFCRLVVKSSASRRKNICISLVPRVAPDNGIKRFSKSNFLHGMKKARFKRAVKHNRQTRNGQLLRSEGNIAVPQCCVSITPMLQRPVQTVATSSQNGRPVHPNRPITDHAALAQRPPIGLPP